MQDAKKRIEYQRQAGRELGKGSGESKSTGKRFRTEIKEVSRITGVPLLRESCTRDDFAVFEQAWYNHCQATFPQDGRVFKNGKYREVPMPTEEHLESFYGAAILAVASRGDLLTKMLLDYKKQFDRRVEERALIHGALLSVCSMRVKEILEDRFPAFMAENEDPLSVWNAIVLLFKFGGYAKSLRAQEGDLAREYENFRQFSGESLSDYARRFTTLLSAYRALSEDPRYGLAVVVQSGPTINAAAPAATVPTGAPTRGRRGAAAAAAAVAAVMPMAAAAAGANIGDVGARVVTNPRLREEAAAYIYCNGLDPGLNPAFRYYFTSEEAKGGLGGENGLPRTVEDAIRISESFLQKQTETSFRLASRGGKGGTRNTVIYAAGIEEEEPDIEPPRKPRKNVEPQKGRGRTHDDDWLSKQTCHKCGKKGHLRNSCPSKDPKDDKPKSQSTDKEAKGGKTKEVGVSFFTVDELADAMLDHESISAYVTGVEEIDGGIQDVNVSMNAVSDKGIVFLDSGASDHVVCDRELLTNLREDTKKYRITGFTGDAIVTQTIGDFGCFGRAIYVPAQTNKGAKNVVSPGRLRITGNECKVEYCHEKGYTITSPSGDQYHFDLDKDGLYQCGTCPITVGVSTLDPSTVHERELQFSRARRERA